MLETLAGYIGIAIQNARLYASLEQKIAQYERLKEFNENIVESINVGVLAVDLEDRIESWNSQMEVMYALPRWRRSAARSVKSSRRISAQEFYRRSPESGHSQSLQVPHRHHGGRHAHSEHRHRAVGHARTSASSAA